MNRSRPDELRVSIAGFGAIGKRVAASLDAEIPGLRLVAVSAKNLEKARKAVKEFRNSVKVVPLERISDDADVVVECAPAELLVAIAEPTLRSGKHLIVISSGALFNAPHLINLAREHGGRITVPTGALLGLDAVKAAALGNIASVRMVTRKPVQGLKGAPHLTHSEQEIEGIDQPKLIFSGTAAEAIGGFPANLNVAISLGMAGTGPENVQLEVWADPNVTRNTHTIDIISDSADITMTIRNIPSDENPKTGKITALSIIAALKRLVEPVVIGT